MPPTVESDSVLPSSSLDQIFLFVYNLLFPSEVTQEKVLSYAREVWSVVSVLGIILIVLLVGAITYTLLRLTQVRKEENLRFQESTYKEEALEPTDERWQRVVELSISTHPSDWRLSIIEADVLLDELLTEKGYSGENLGDKLKAARQQGGLKNIDKAWEAHLVRNQVAHAGSDFILTQREARRTVDLYRRVFEGSSLV